MSYLFEDFGLSSAPRLSASLLAMQLGTLHFISGMLAAGRTMTSMQLGLVSAFVYFHSSVVDGATEGPRRYDGDELEQQTKPLPGLYPTAALSDTGKSQSSCKRDESASGLPRW
jgi:hypothetical protein